MNLALRGSKNFYHQQNQNITSFQSAEHKFRHFVQFSRPVVVAMVRLDTTLSKHGPILTNTVIRQLTEGLTLCRIWPSSVDFQVVIFLNLPRENPTAARRPA